jgi:peptidyl-prolyl cis-trans isomerase C
MESIINKTLLFQEADKKNIQPAQKEIDAELNNIVSRFPAPDMFEKQLSTMGITREKLLQDITQNLKISTLVKDSTGEVPAVTDEEISSFYNGNPQNFQAPEQVKASHILFKVNPDDAQELKDQKRLELAALRGQIEKGADFAKLAKENSECPSKERGGDLGFFGRGSMVKPFEDTAFSMKNGDVSQVVETQFGYHLIKVVDRKESRTVPLEEVKEKISTHLTSEKERELFGVYLTELRKTAKIEYAENE